MKLWGPAKMCSLPMSLLWSECDIFKYKIKIYFSFNQGKGKKDQLKNKYKRIKKCREKIDHPEELWRKHTRNTEEEQEKEKKVIIVPFSDMKLRYVNSFISSKKCSQHLEGIRESEAKCCQGVLMDTSGWQGRCSTFSISVLQPATHFLSAGRSHGSDWWQLGRDLKNNAVVLLPPSHKHTFACIAEAATIIFTQSSLLGRARRAHRACRARRAHRARRARRAHRAHRARVAFVCCSPARKQIILFLVMCWFVSFKKNFIHFKNYVNIHLYACLSQ